MVAPTTSTGNAAAINGLAAGNTTPNFSTRAGFQQTTGLFNSPFTPAGNVTGATISITPGGQISITEGPGAYTADVNLSSTATSNIGTGLLGGSSAISAGNVTGILSSDILINGDIVDPVNPANLGRFISSATGNAASTATTGTGVTREETAAAAVVDLAAAGILDSGFTFNGNAQSVDFFASLNGNAAANGTAVGNVTDPGTGAITQDVATAPALDGTGVNSILNLNSRGISNSNQYFQDPISPFFAQFSGLVPGPLPSETLLSPVQTPGATFSSRAPINASASVTGSNTARNGQGNTNAFSGLFSSGILLSNNLGNYRGGISADSAVGSELSGVATSSTTNEGSSSAISNTLSIGIGTAAVRQTAAPSNLIAPALVRIVDQGDVKGSALANVSTSSQSLDGDTVAFNGGLTGSGGNTFATDFNPGNTLTVGLFNVDIQGDPGAGPTNIEGSAGGLFAASASTGNGTARASQTGITNGILGADLSAGAIPASVDISTQSGNLLGRAVAINSVLAETLGGGSAYATSFMTTGGITNANLTIIGDGSSGASASLNSSVTAIA